MGRFQLDLAESELKFIHEALSELENKMSKLSETSDHQEATADIGSDLIEVRLRLKPLKESAIRH